MGGKRGEQQDGQGEKKVGVRVDKGRTLIGRSRNRQVAQAVMRVGPSEEKVAEETGLKPGFVRAIMERESFKEMLAKELDRRGLGMGRYLDEVARGLDEGKVDKHSFYVEKHRELLGLDGSKDSNGAPQVQVNLLINEMEKRGLK